jgi:hypothetical protein
MKRSIALLLGFALLAITGASLARGGSGGHFSGGHGGSHMSGGAHPAPGHFHGSSGGHPHGHHVFVGGAFFVGGPYPYYYYPPYYYPYYDAAPVYQDPPVYVEQADEVRYYCPDYRDYYPNVPNCPSQWLQVVPGAGGYTR